MAAFFRWLAARERAGKFGWSSLAGAAAATLWLWFARRAFLGGPIGPAGALWLLLAAGALAGALHLGWRAARRAWPGQPLEMGRWLALAAGATWVLLPCYTRDSFGAGDSYWYTLMLGDFVAQIRHGAFPVWIGQSPFAYNGAVTPLRVAPWLQHAGGLLDLATAGRLGPTALKNALLSLNGLAIAASAYLGLRAILARRPGLACALALLWLAGPGVLAPLYFNDQYMMFLAMPFLPPLLLGCWRLWAEDRGRLPIAAALAGLWLAHTPMALWGSLTAGGMYAGLLVARRPGWAEGPRLAGMAGLFLVLGAWPVGSALAIDNPAPMTASGAQVPGEIRSNFPDNFRPINAEHLGPGGVQLGYTLAAIGLASLALLARRRPPGSAAFAAAIVLVAPLILPVPGITAWIWNHTPAWFVSINNVWPMQRLFALWGLLMVFAFAIAVAQPRPGGRRRREALALALLAAGGGWSAYQVTKCQYVTRSTRVEARTADVLLRPENVRLTRYPYASFALAPAYASHGYVDPGLENRLLDRHTLGLLSANADAAAPPAATATGADAARLVQTGIWTATSTVHNRIYTLTPGLRLEPRRRYALRLDFIDPGQPGTLQIYSDDLFREYILPDSGVGISADGPPLAFGSLATSGRVIPLLHQAAGPVEPVLQFILPRYEKDAFDFARFRLYAYDPADLPVRVTSWIPYKAEVQSAGPAFLETPRMWQRGWHAQVNGREVAVQASPHHLAMVPVGAGHSHVVVVFRAPAWLEAWFWLALAGWLALAAWGARRVVRIAFLPMAPG